MSKIKGSGAIASADYKAVKWVGKSKDGKAITIEMAKAVNLGNIEWTFADKDDTIATLEFTAVYSNTDSASASTDEPWTVETNGQTTGAGEIVMGVGMFYIGGTAVALTRGGGSFKVEREYREIAADGDRGPVEGRIVMDGSRATLTMNALTFITRVADMYPGIASVNAQ